MVEKGKTRWGITSTKVICPTDTLQAGDQIIFFKQQKLKFVLIILENFPRNAQECVPFAAVAISGSAYGGGGGSARGCLPGECLPGGGGVSAWGCLPGGLSAKGVSAGGGLPRGGCLPGGCLPRGCLPHTHTSVNRITDTCENTRMHSRRMHTTHLLTVSQHALPGGLYLPRGVYLPWGCTCPGGYLLRESPLWTEWQTGVKILACPKLRLRAVITLPQLRWGW